MVSRFTLDSATDFLFGNDVRSLSAGLPYPYNSPLSASYAHSHPSNVFAQAFGEAQRLSGLRSRYGSAWPLKEFWQDKVELHRKVINKFIDPILAEAIAKKQMAQGGSAKKNGEWEVKDGDTLLDHLVNYTEGKWLLFHASTFNSLVMHIDPNVLKDETMNIMIAGRMCAIHIFCTNLTNDRVPGDTVRRHLLTIARLTHSGTT
jgi:hypothetical protein